MPRHALICTVCQSIDERLVAAGEHPACRQCGGATERFWSGQANAVIGDDIPGGQWQENGFAEPRKFYSKSERQKALAAEGLTIRDDNRGPLDTICPRWDSVDLEGAAQLVMRGVEARLAKRKTHFPKATEPITATTGETFRA